MRLPLVFLPLLGLSFGVAATALAQDDHDYPVAAPYQDIAFSADSVTVSLDGEWYALTAIDGVAVAEIVAFAKRTYASRWEKRFAEDLVEVLSRMGHPPTATVALGLASEGRVVTRAAVPMTAANREALWQARLDRARADTAPTTLSLAALEEDVRAFRDQLEGRFAYLHANGVDLDEAIAELRSRLQDGMPVATFGLHLRRVVGQFIDGHAAVRGVDPPDGYLPFLVVPSGRRFVAIKGDRKGFIDPDRPFLTAIDGRPLAEWLAAADPLIARGSPQYVLRQRVSHLRALPYLRTVLDRPADDSVTVRLEDGAGRRAVTRTLALARAMPLYGIWPRRPSRLLAGNIGYLRLASMDDEAVAAVREWMPTFRNTRGLIIDVRGNGGGTRDALRELFPYFIGPREGPHVANVAKYRRFQGFDADHLASRGLYRADAPHWSVAEAQAIADVQATFTPEWEPPAGEFSAWHYLVLSRRPDDSRLHYDRPVVILSDPDCFSATDIFLGAFKGWPRVTILGQPSGGGSARSVAVPLPNSRLEIRLASMASFQPTGRLYDGHGTEPDRAVAPVPDYWIEGGRDVVLEEAVRMVGR